MSSEKEFARVAPGAEGVDYDHPLAAHVEILDRQTADVRTTRKKVALVGFASSTRELAPFDDPTFEIWGMNQLYRHIPRADRFFDIHYYFEEGNVEGTDHLGWLRDGKIPVYMTTTHDEYPTSVRFPIEDAIEVAGVDYFTSTVAFMVALAIREKFEVIKVYGIDLIVGSEYEWQKACVEYLLGIAHGRGIDVGLPERCALLACPWRYGYEKEPKAWPIVGSELISRQELLTIQRDEGRKRVTMLEGASVECKHWIENTDPVPSAMTEHLSTLQQKIHEQRAQVALLDGALQEAGYWAQISELRQRQGHVELPHEAILKKIKEGV